MTRGRFININQFLETLPSQFNGETSQDITDLANCIFYAIDSNIGQDFVGQNPLVSLTGDLSETLECTSCSQERSMVQPFLILSLPCTEKSVINIQEELNNFLGREMLDDPVECPQCGFTKHYKLQSITKISGTVLVSLKLFDNNGTKNLNAIVAPDQISLCVGGNEVQGRLIAYACHQGRSLVD